MWTQEEPCSRPAASKRTQRLEKPTAGSVTPARWPSIHCTSAAERASSSSNLRIHSAWTAGSAENSSDSTRANSLRATSTRASNDRRIERLLLARSLVHDEQRIQPEPRVVVNQERDPVFGVTDRNDDLDVSWRHVAGSRSPRSFDGLKRGSDDDATSLITYYMKSGDRLWPRAGSSGQRHQRGRII